MVAESNSIFGHVAAIGHFVSVSNVVNVELYNDAATVNDMRANGKSANGTLVSISV